MQSVFSSFLYYGRAIDNTIVPVLNEISLKQAAPTEHTNTKIQMLLDYLKIYSNAKLRFHASDMKLYVDSDAAYLVAPRDKSCIVGLLIAATTHLWFPQSKA